MHQLKRSGLAGIFFSILTLGATCTASAATIVSALKVDDGLLSATGWSFGGQSGGVVSVSKITANNLLGSAGSIVGSYPVATGGVYAWGVYDVSALKTNEIYVDFWAKMPGAKQGLKFLKVFGGNSGTSNNYANTTFALDYTGADMGAMRQVSFGDGSGVGNDTQNVINFDSSNPNWIGRSYGKATVLTPQKKTWASSNWGTGWHHFRVHLKFNSGTTAANEIADGEYYVEIDDVVYVDAKGLFNRHYSNAPIERVELFGWAQNGKTPFEVWYDDIRISTGGFTTSSTATPATTAPSAPASPSNFKVTN